MEVEISYFKIKKDSLNFRVNKNNKILDFKGSLTIKR